MFTVNIYFISVNVIVLVGKMHYVKPQNAINSINGSIVIYSLHLHCSFLGTQSALHGKGISSSTTSVQHSPG